MKITRRHGRARLRLEPEEVAVLQSMLDELDALLAASAESAENDETDENAEADDQFQDEVLARLNPAAYRDDAGAEEEYRALTASSLRELRDERLAACRADLAVGGEIELDPETGRRWIQVLNDLRLALGTRLGVTEDDDHDVDPTDPDAQPRVVYYWLTAVQDSVVRVLMRSSR
ncbi:MAG TPA: DUF2017 family protein [Jatrophihabitans sp.]|nr:DUF2017 family protein [Jatrophihabitans sp.]